MKRLRVLISLLMISVFILNPYATVSTINQTQSHHKRSTGELINELKHQGISDSTIESLQEQKSFFEEMKNVEEVYVIEQYSKLDLATNKIKLVTEEDELEYIIQEFNNSSEGKLETNDNGISSYESITQNSSVYQKQIITTTKTSKRFDGKPVYAVGYLIQWLKMPVNRLTDVLSITIDGSMSIITNDSTFPISTETKVEYNYIKTDSSHRVLENITEYNYGTLSSVTTKAGIIAGEWDLPDDSYKETYTGASIPTPVYHQTNVTDMQALIVFFTVCKDTSVIGFDAWGEYYHQESLFEIYPSASAKASGSGLPFPTKKMKYMNEMTHNLSLFTIFK